MPSSSSKVGVSAGFFPGGGGAGVDISMTRSRVYKCINGEGDIKGGRSKRAAVCRRRVDVDD
ncbi:hypothetical protein P0O24_02885 [Methanotrichaceae archaeon M04Ac]|jgi:hypothetical protein|uniref:Uncharacterized protein n=1 Tax=Candidatus Methanocrinis alkalitolerans TaxID=3033395 RepID=A0ABT5XDA2_9EURY|nr:hypothetical protein [Candidatus Methanocrinis alkalitolerans]MDF0592527.1 hypothetical protein [Candidatus Methanocrinis alkalitolerans]